jgi:hypothetical protein
MMSTGLWDGAFQFVCTNRSAGERIRSSLRVRKIITTETKTKSLFWLQKTRSNVRIYLGTETANTDQSLPHDVHWLMGRGLSLCLHESVSRGKNKIITSSTFEYVDNNRNEIETPIRVYPMMSTGLWDRAFHFVCMNRSAGERIKSSLRVRSSTKITTETKTKSKHRSEFTP